MSEMEVDSEEINKFLELLAETPQGNF